MRGSRIADSIVNEMRKKEYYQKKVTRRKCVLNGEKKCDRCYYSNICDDIEDKGSELDGTGEENR